MIIITGAAGFIGSALVSILNAKGLNDLVIVDDFSEDAKNANLADKEYKSKVHRKELFKWFEQEARHVSAVYHLGARTDTTETDQAIFDELNLDYSRKVWDICSQYNIPLVYASSAATYGKGELGYRDEHQLSGLLNPLNAYGKSKNDFDLWALKQEKQPPFWAGLKFFNVYGPNEYHKGRMASVVYHAYHQIVERGYVELFRSHRPDFEDGEQKRDFIYVKDIVQLCTYFMEKKPAPGLYNAGTGNARSFRDLAAAVFKSMQVEENIHFVDMPEDIRANYQYFTEADSSKLLASGYDKAFFTLEEGISDYVRNYLRNGRYL